MNGEAACHQSFRSRFPARGEAPAKPVKGCFRLESPFKGTTNHPTKKSAAA